MPRRGSDPEPARRGKTGRAQNRIEQSDAQQASQASPIEGMPQEGQFGLWTTVLSARKKDKNRNRKEELEVAHF